MTSVLPLAGLRVLVPRSESTAAPLVRLLGDVGAEVHAVPLIAIEPPADLAGLDSAVLALGSGDYDWVGFASANAVAAMVDRAAALRIAPAVPADTRIAAVGQATGTALRQAKLPVDLQPAEHSSAARLAEIWPLPTHPGSRVLLPGSSIGLPVLPEALAAKGYQVDRVIAYAPRPLPVPAEVADDATSGRYHAILLTSPSIVAVLAAAATPPRTTLIGCIGRTTATAATAAGLDVSFVATEATMAALVDGLISAVAHQETGTR